MLTHAIRLSSLAALFFIVGCSHAEFDLIQPPDLAQHVGTKASATLPMAPLEYWLIAYEDHLVMRIWNRSDSTIEFVAAQSTVIDPRGQSHLLPSPNRTLFPGTFVKLILPPVGPRLVPTGPTIGFGFGTSFGSRRRYGYGGGFAYGYPWAYDPFYGPPRYYAVYPGDDSIYWDWPDGGTVRLFLVYWVYPQPMGPPGPATRPAEPPPPFTITHQLVFRRRNV